MTAKKGDLAMCANENCHKAFVVVGNKLFCSPPCRIASYVRGLNPWAASRPEIATGTVGAASELFVSAYLLQRGVGVFRALSPSCPVDLVALTVDGFVGIEVKTGYRRRSGKISFARAQTIADVQVVWLREEDEPAFLPLSDLGRVFLEALEQSLKLGLGRKMIILEGVL